MTNTIGVERLYSLEQYNNIKFVELIDEIPDDKFLNEEFYDALRLLQLIRIDRQFLRYLKLSSTLLRKVLSGELDIDTSLEILDGMEQDTKLKLNEILKQKE